MTGKNQVGFRDPTMFVFRAAIDENEGVPRSLTNNLKLALNQDTDSNDLNYSELEQLLIHN